MNASTAYILAQPADKAAISGLVGGLMVAASGRPATRDTFTITDMHNVDRFPEGTPVSGDALAIFRAA